MVKLNSLLLTLLIAVLGFAVPTAFVFWFAQQQGMEAEQERSLVYASEVLAKSETVVTSFTDLVTRLSPLMVGNPCDPENLDLMEYASLSARDIKALGYVENNQLLCSSLNIPGRTFDMGTADYVLPLSPPLMVRSDVFIPRIGDMEFVVFEQGGISGIIQAQQPLEAVADSEDILVAVYGIGRERSLFENGAIGLDWQSHLPEPGTSASFVEDNYIVAIARSVDFGLIAVAARPTTYLQAYSQELLAYLLPIGLIAGAVLIWAIAFLSRHQLAMPQAIKSGLRRGEFYLVYQPIIDLKTGRWTGAEALMRWRRSNGEVISPEVFMAVAEESGLIHLMTERLFELVEQDARKLFALHDTFHLSLNLAASDIHDPAVVPRLQQLMRSCRARPGQLFAEVTERGLTRPDQAIDIIHRLREEGIPVAVDDFGTGYSSLSYLETFDLDYLKIDKFFVDSIEADASVATSTVLLHIIEMAKSLKLQMIAEGVETEAQRAALLEYGVDYAQGWLFSKPMKCSLLLKRLRNEMKQAPPALTGMHIP
ncbi:EAL domain-containing protein [Haliea sp. E17]|uniref:EAL domain-containing protein n=1 Tax=Haliea sp. E17 TaxID=3401576 RepID=UPI003AAC2CCE